MVRITISVSDDTANRIRREARRRRIAVSELVRAAVELELRPTGGRRLGFAAIGRSGSRDTARRVDEILGEEWSHARRR